MNSENQRRKTAAGTVGYGIFFILMSAFLATILQLGNQMPGWALGIGGVVISCLAVMVAALFPGRK